MILLRTAPHSYPIDYSVIPDKVAWGIIIIALLFATYIWLMVKAPDKPSMRKKKKK